MTKLIALVLAAGALSACATTQTKVPVEVMPALDVPPVPARIIEPAPGPPMPPPVEPVGDLPPVSPTSSRPRPQPQRDTAKAADPKIEAAPVEAAAPPVTAPPVVQPPVPPLRTPNTPDGSEAARRVREINERVLRMLNTTDYQGLNPERKATYQHAKLLVNEAEDAVKAANFEFAKSLAEKAERLAKDLQSR